jgi:hypothetical protein
MAKQFEGTWEEVSANESALIGHRVRVTVLDKQEEGQPGVARNRTTASEPQETEGTPNIVPGRNHGKLYKDWPQEVRETDISSSEFDALDTAIAENRAMRRAVAQETHD